MKKRILSLLLAVVLAVGLVPTAAAFSDVDDAELAAKIDLLAELGIIDGYTDGTFRPNQLLKRAEFTKLVVTMLGRQDDRSLYAGYTIFTDVTSTHWAAGYINLAARGVDKGGLALVKGYTDGSFRPDATIELGEAVTIVLRALGFADADVGYNWPQDYISKAAASGLTAGVTLGAEDAVGRADGARIFYNALFVEAKDGKRLIDGMYGEVIDSALIVSVSGDGVLVYGRDGWLANAAGLTADAVGRRYRLTLDESGETAMIAEEAKRETATVDSALIHSVEVEDGLTYISVDGGDAVLALAGAGEALVGSRVKLVVDKASGVVLEISSLASNSVTIAFAYYSGDEVTATDGAVYEIPADLPVYTAEEGLLGRETTFGAVRDDLSYGDALEIVFDDKGEAEYAVARTGEATVAVVEPGETQSAVLAELGAPSGTKLYKNGVEVTFASLADYDVLSYSAGGAITVSDFRLGAMYTYATPNSSAPTAITVFGSTLRLAPCAKASVAGFKPLERMTLLFAADGRVAGAIAPTSERRVGVYTGTSVQFVGGPELGMVLGGFDAGALVSVGVNADGDAVGYSVRESAATAALDLENGTVGTAKLAAGCVFYECAADGAAPKRIERGDILAPTVAAADILHIGYNSSGQAEVIILGDVTGDGYTYGRLMWTIKEETAGGTVLSFKYDANVIDIEHSEGTTSLHMTQTIQIPDGIALSGRIPEGKSVDDVMLNPRYAWGGIITGSVKSPQGGTAEQVVAIKLLDESYEVGRANFSGSTAVVVEGETLPIADGVLVWLDSTDVFLGGDYDTQAQLVSAARAQSDRFEVLVSEGKVRVIIVK